MIPADSFVTHAALDLILKVTGSPHQFSHIIGVPRLRLDDGSQCAEPLLAKLFPFLYRLAKIGSGVVLKKHIHIHFFPPAKLKQRVRGTDAEAPIFHAFAEFVEFIVFHAQRACESSLVSLKQVFQ